MEVAADIAPAPAAAVGADGGRDGAAGTMVRFGASGALARRKILPARYDLAQDGLLPGGVPRAGTSVS